SALGGDVRALAHGLLEGRCGIGLLTLFAHRGRSAIAAQVGELLPVEHRLPPAVARRLSRSDRLALVAAFEACRMAGLDVTSREAAGLAVGGTTAGMLETEDAYRRWRASRNRPARLSGFVGMPISTVGSALSQGLGVFGPRLTVSTAC